MEEDEDLKVKRFLKKRNFILNTICIILALAGIIWLSRFFFRYGKYEITNDAFVDQYMAPLSIRASGYVRDVRFTEFQEVAAGDTLLVLEKDEYLIRQHDAQAALAEAYGNLEVLEYTILAARQNMDARDAEIDEKKARLWQLEQDDQRYESLILSDAVSRQQYEQMKAEYKATEAMIKVLESTSAAAQAQFEEAKSRKKSLEAVIRQKEADLEMARLDLSYTVLTAPYDGVVGRRTLEPGQYVRNGQVVTYLVRSHDKWVTANFRETQISNIHVGQKVRIKVDAYRNKTFRGTVTAISEATGSKYSLVPTDNAAGNFVKIQQRIPVRIDLEEVSPQEMAALRAGMMVVVEAIKSR